MPKGGPYIDLVILNVAMCSFLYLCAYIVQFMRIFFARFQETSTMLLNFEFRYFGQM